jgi:hypothetical protein
MDRQVCHAQSVEGHVLILFFHHRRARIADKVLEGRDGTKLLACKSNNQPQGHKVPFVGSYYDLVSEVIILG